MRFHAVVNIQSPHIPWINDYLETVEDRPMLTLRSTILVRIKQLEAIECYLAVQRT